MLPENIACFIKPLLNMECCRKKVGDYKNLSIGFGEKVYHNNPKLVDNYYGEWELGSYFSTWRILIKDKILCSSRDLVDTIIELDETVKDIELGRIVSLDEINGIDVRLSFDTGKIIDFLATISGEDEEYFHIIGPNNIYIKLSNGGVWTIKDFKKRGVQ